MTKITASSSFKQTKPKKQSPLPHVYEGPLLWFKGRICPIKKSTISCNHETGPILLLLWYGIVRKQAIVGRDTLSLNLERENERDRVEVMSFLRTVRLHWLQCACCRYEPMIYMIPLKQ